MEAGDLVMIAVYDGCFIPTESQISGIIIETRDEPASLEPRADVLTSAGLLESVPARWMRVISKTGLDPIYSRNKTE